MDAEIFGLARVIADGLQVQTERRMHDPPHQQTCDDQQAEAIVVERASEKLDLVIPLERKPQYVHAGNAHSAVTAGQVIEFKQERIEQHAEGKRQHAKENSYV